MENERQIPELIQLCNYDNDGKTCINPAQVAMLHDIPKCDKWDRRTRVDMIPEHDGFGTHGASCLVKETASYIRTAMDKIRLGGMLSYTKTMLHKDEQEGNDG